MSNDNSTVLLAFKCISSFISDLASVFGDTQIPLKLYDHLISKTTMKNEKVILKHVELFRTFCITNRDAIEQNKCSMLTTSLIEYSDNAKIDMKIIFAESDYETKKIIWKHLLTIASLVDSSGHSRKILKESVETKPEADFISNILDKIEDIVDPNADPMTAISKIMSSGIFTELISNMGSGIQNGTLDINKLMNGVQKMTNKMNSDASTESGGTAQSPDISQLLGPMMGMLNNTPGSNKGGGAPDISQLLGPMMGMLNNTPGSNKGGDAPDISQLMGMLNNSSDDHI